MNNQYPIIVFHDTNCDDCGKALKGGNGKAHGDEAVWVGEDPEQAVFNVQVYGTGTIFCPSCAERRQQETP